jgi:hypothetical protein
MGGSIGRRMCDTSVNSNATVELVWIPSSFYRSPMVLRTQRPNLSQRQNQSWSHVHLSPAFLSCCLFIRLFCECVSADV